MGYLGNKPILNAARAMREKYPLQQFGQPYDSKWKDGAQACAPTAWQFITRFWTNRHYTLDQLAVLAGHPANSGGMTISQTKQLIVKLGLPYKYVLNSDWTPIHRASALGPVFVPTLYGWWPEWRGYRYGGLVADGKPNGFAIKNGKTQLTGFNGPDSRHATVLLGYLGWDSTGDGIADTYRDFVMEPNHNSPARPEDPPYDEIDWKQYRAAYQAFRSATGMVYAFVPTRIWSQP